MRIERIVRRRPVLAHPPECMTEVYWLITGDELPERGLLFGTHAEAEAAARQFLRKKYIVSTHLGDFTTTAPSPEKVLSNIRFRIFRRSPAAMRYTANWTVRECA